MRAVVQRVKNASVEVDQNCIGKIGKGLLIYLGVTHDDEDSDLQYMADKIPNLRIFEDEEGKMNKSINVMGYEILNISQFTLYGDTSKGNRPSFTKAMDSVKAEELYIELSNILNNTYNIKTYNGVFGAHMDIKLINDGPVTIIIEGKEKR